ncbi:MAG: cell division protein FtsA [Spirochaetae bacterium HGW-Spirochaetae-9]|nr:MAG: cell division protein FtsA [Spirochaetae bacterium HGW-Spirochaetae-9]
MVGLDIGTTSTRAVVGDFNEEDQLEIIGVGVAPSTGLRRGVVLNIEATLSSVSSAIESAELMSGREIHSCVLGISGANVESLNSKGVVAVAGKGREITADDIGRVHEAAKAVSIAMDREILHVIPQTYSVDAQRGIRDPLHMMGVRLESEVHIITSSVTTTQNMAKCVNRAGYKPDRFILGSLAAARSVLSSDERDLGCLLMDIGGGTTDLMVFRDGEPWYTSAVPAGGMQVTNDISIMLSVLMDSAERLKREAASCWLESIDADELIVVPGIGGREPTEIPRRKLCAIVQPRMEEIFLMAKEKLDKAGYLKDIKAGIVLTGGASLMAGARELAESVFGVPAHLGTPPVIGGLGSEYRNPMFATAVGLVLLEADAQLALDPSRGQASARKDKSRASSLGKIVTWLKDKFI